MAAQVRRRLPMLILSNEDIEKILPVGACLDEHSLLA
jgi:hypothetical protein